MYNSCKLELPRCKSHLAGIDAGDVQKQVKMIVGMKGWQLGDTAERGHGLTSNPGGVYCSSRRPARRAASRLRSTKRAKRA